MVKTILKLLFFIVFIENICKRKSLHVFNTFWDKSWLFVLTIMKTLQTRMNFSIESSVYLLTLSHSETMRLGVASYLHVKRCELPSAGAVTVIGCSDTADATK